MKSLILGENPINGQRTQLKEWSQIKWRKTLKIVRNLQRRIFRARKLGQWKQLRRLQKLLIRSYANLLLSIRQITQLNKGKQTSGVDKEVITTPAERVKLANNWEMPNASPTRRVYIPKPNGKKRPLGIPTIRDRVSQALMKSLLEPELEAVFEANSYGFRAGRSCHDAIQGCSIKLNSHPLSGGHKSVLDADIKGFFDNIAHESILTAIGSLRGIELIERWLKAGFLFEGIHNPTKTGTPQGGVISPLLAIIGLHGMEQFIKNLDSKLGFVRYADDFIITAKDKESLENVLPQLKQWLSQRGLELSDEKTKIVNIEKGFDCLGFNLKQYNGKLLIKPQKSKVLAFCRKIGRVIKDNYTAEQESLIRVLNPLLRGFANYYKSGVSKEVFSYIHDRVWRYLWKWAKRRHPNKSKKWVTNKYFGHYRGNNWAFLCQTKDRRNKNKTIVLFDIAKVSIERHIKVKGEASPFDSTQKEYWENRKTKLGKSYWEKNSKMWNIAQIQSRKCPVCKEHLFNGDEIETHHILPVAAGGLDDIGNLQHLHGTCHKQVHYKPKNMARSKAPAQ